MKYLRVCFLCHQHYGCIEDGNYRICHIDCFKRCVPDLAEHIVKYGRCPNCINKEATNE